jgi:hypothetical protein
MPVYFLDFADTKQNRPINVRGETKRVTDQVEKFWRHFRRIDEEFANEMVLNYKTVWQFIQFARSVYGLKRPDTLANTSFGFEKLIASLANRFEQTPIIGKQHTLSFAVDFNISSRPSISFRFFGLWHTFKEFPIAPAAFRDEPLPSVQHSDWHTEPVLQFFP